MWFIQYIGSGNVISEPMLAYCQLGPQEQKSVTFESKHNNYHSWKCIWRCCLKMVTNLTRLQCVQQIHCVLYFYTNRWYILYCIGRRFKGPNWLVVQVIVWFQWNGNLVSQPKGPWSVTAKGIIGLQLINSHLDWPYATGQIRICDEGKLEMLFAYWSNIGFKIHEHSFTEEWVIVIIIVLGGLIVNTANNFCTCGC